MAGSLPPIFLQNPSSVRTTEAIERVRERVLRFFNTTSKTHTLVFTSGATGAMSLLADTFPWENGNPPASTTGSKENMADPASFTYLNSNHTSVVGIRGVAERMGAQISTLTANEMRKLAAEIDSEQHTKQKPLETASKRRRKRHCLFAYPAQCNFSGSRYPLEWVDCVQSGALNRKLAGLNTPGKTRTTADDSENEGEDSQWHVLLDTSAYVSCAELDLTSVGADFVTVSFYKMFGYPTGLGALIIRNEALADHHDEQEMGNATEAQLGHVNNTKVQHNTDHHKRGKSYTAADGDPHTSQDTSAATHNTLEKMHIKSALGWLNKKYYGGGTLALSDNASGTHVFASQLAAALENGTVSYLSILALNDGLDALERVGGMSSISKHTHTVAHWLYYQLSQLKHSSTQKPVCVLYSTPDCWQATADKTSAHDKDYDTQSASDSVRSSVKQGPVITMNLQAPDGSAIGYAHVAQLAALEKIHVRTGCLCNTGACHESLGLDLQDVLSNYRSGHTCGDGIDILNGRPTGALRVSCGYMTTIQDVKRFFGFVCKYFVDDHSDLNLQSRRISFSQTTGEEIGDVELHITDTPKLDNTLEGQDGGGVLSDEHPSRLTGEQSSDTTAVNVVLTPSDPEADPAISTLASTHPDSHLSACEATLTHMYVYPIKSCGAMEVPQGSTWAMTAQGLAFDRMWMIVDALTNKPLTMKTHDTMCLIKPTLELCEAVEDGLEDTAGIGLSVQDTDAVPGAVEKDPSAGAEVVSDVKGVTLKASRAPRAQALRLNAPGMREIVIPLNGLDGFHGQQLPKNRDGTESTDNSSSDTGSTAERQSKTTVNADLQTQTIIQDCPPDARTTVRVCNRRVSGVKEVSDDAHAWLSEILGVPCTLVRCAAKKARATAPADEDGTEPTMGNDGKNDSPFLVVNADSVHEINRVATQMLSSTASDETPSQSAGIHALQFRPNFVVKTDVVSEPFAEDRWTELSFPAHETTALGVRKECVRCQLVCVDPRTGERSKVPLQALGLCRQKKLTFGMYLNLLSDVRMPNHPHIVVCAECFEDKEERTKQEAQAIHHRTHARSYMSKLVPAGEEIHVHSIRPGDLVQIKIKAIEAPVKKQRALYSGSECDTATSLSSDDDYDSVTESVRSPVTVSETANKPRALLAAPAYETHTSMRKNKKVDAKPGAGLDGDTTRQVTGQVGGLAQRAQTNVASTPGISESKTTSKRVIVYDSSDSGSESETDTDTDTDADSDTTTDDAEDSDLSKEYYDDDG